MGRTDFITSSLHNHLLKSFLHSPSSLTHFLSCLFWVILFNGIYFCEWLLHPAPITQLYFLAGYIAGMWGRYQFLNLYLFNGHSTKPVLSYTLWSALWWNPLGFACWQAHNLQLRIILSPPLLILILLHLLQLPI